MTLAWTVLSPGVTGNTRILGVGGDPVTHN
jgi:hypothetical protein